MNRKKLSNNEMTRVVCFVKYLLLSFCVDFCALTKLFFQNYRL